MPITLVGNRGTCEMKFNGRSARVERQCDARCQRRPDGISGCKNRRSIKQSSKTEALNIAGRSVNDRPTPLNRAGRLRPINISCEE